MELQIYTVAIDMVRQLRPLIEQIRTRYSNLADQLRRAATSVPLNLHEGAYSQGRNVPARCHNALGSAAEVRACLDLAEAMGYLDQVDLQEAEHRSFLQAWQIRQLLPSK